MRHIGQTERLHLWLNYGVGYAVKQFSETCRRFPDLSEAYDAARRKRISELAFLPARAVERLTAAAEDGFLDAFIERLDGMGIDVVMPMHADYPPLLKQIFDPPSVLYVKGSLAPEPPVSIAVVGTRTPSDYGKRMAETFSYALASAGACVVSGLAAGVDTCAARGALAVTDADCPTVAVLGSGIDVVYPRGNERLFAEIAACGAVVTEFLPGEPPAREHFPIRNRIVSGLSHGVLVVEAAERSGTSITVGCAHEQGREVFALPGAVDAPCSAAPHRLLREGARLITSAGDILEDMGWGAPAATRQITLEPADLTMDQRRLYDALCDEPKSLDLLMDELGMTAARASVLVTQLELMGCVEALPGRFIRRAGQ